MKAAILIRVSTLEQGKKGYSIPEQLSAGHSMAQKLGCAYVDEFIEEESGAFLDTPGLEVFRDALKANNYRYVICLDPDRLARNLVRQLVVASEIEQAKAELVFIHGEYANNAEGRLFFSIRGAISEYEREKIKQRTQSGLRRKALSGKVPRSGRPFGYDYDSTSGTYVINEDEAEAVRLMFKWIGSEKTTLYETCRRLAGLGIQTKNNSGAWRTNTVAGIVHNTLYFGEAVAFKKMRRKVAPGEYVNGQHPKENWVIIPVPAIITRDEFEAAQAALRENYDKAPRNTKNPYLLQGLVYCPLCGHRMGVCYDGRIRISYFFCRTGTRAENKEPRSPRCAARQIPMAKLEDMVEKTFFFYAENPDRLREYLNSSKINEDEGSIKTLEAHLNKLCQKKDLYNKEREKIARLFRKSLINEDNVEKQLSEIVKEEAETQKQIESIKEKLSRSNKKSGEVENFINIFIDAARGYGSISYYSKKAVLENIISRIEARRTDKTNTTAKCELDICIFYKL